MAKLPVILGALCALVVTNSPAAAQPQVVNPDADVRVAAPAWAAGRGPRVLIDEGHRNFHTIGGRYAPFAALLRNDGYRVGAMRGPFSRQSLAEADVIVIANASAPEGERPAFRATEISELRRWVSRGGSLLLIADHAPFAGAVHQLASTFGVTFRNAYAISTRRGGHDIFTRDSGLADHPITRGGRGDGAVTAVRTFTGSAFEAPRSEPLLTLTSEFDLFPGPSTSGPGTPATGLHQGAALRFGRGRIVVVGEAAMFTSQLQGVERRLMGFGAEGAEQNQRFALNILHWLSRRPGY
jgi:hypothetical protein